MKISTCDRSTMIRDQSQSSVPKGRSCECECSLENWCFLRSKVIIKCLELLVKVRFLVSIISVLRIPQPAMRQFILHLRVHCRIELTVNCYWHVSRLRDKERSSHVNTMWIELHLFVESFVVHSCFWICCG